MLSVRDTNVRNASVLCSLAPQQPERHSAAGAHAGPAAKKQQSSLLSCCFINAEEPAEWQPSLSRRSSTVTRTRSLPRGLQRLTSELQAAVTAAVVRVRAQWVTMRCELQAWATRRRSDSKNKAASDPRASPVTPTDATEVDGAPETIMLNGKSYRVRNEWV